MAYKFDLSAMLKKFGVVTVMDVEFYDAVRFTEDDEDNNQYVGDWDAVSTFNTKGKNGELEAKDPLFRLDTLKISNINQEGPTKTITGGMNADTLLKYGKTYSVEMTDALGRFDVLKYMYGANTDTLSDGSDLHQVISFTDAFPGEMTLVGKTFVIDQKTGAKQPIRIVIPVFLGDGIFNLSMDAEGDATTFDLNGNILVFESGAISKEATEDKIYAKGADKQFYFFVTEEGFKNIKKDGWEAVMYRATDSNDEGPTDPGDTM